MPVFSCRANLLGSLIIDLIVEGRGHIIGNNDSTKSANDISSTSIATARSGTISSPKDPRFKIEYQFDGVAIESTDIFAAYLESLATVAQFDNETTADAMNMYSQNRHCEISINGFPEESEFVWGHIINALLMIWEQLFIDFRRGRKQRWEGITFLIEYNGKYIGEGLVILNGQGRTPASR